MININPPTTDVTIDLTSSIDDTLYSYDIAANGISTTMNTINYPSSSSGSNVYITNNTGTINPTWGITDTLTLGNITSTPLKVQGDAEIEGNLKLGGKNINKLLDKIEERLAILHPNEELEDRWEELKELSRRYKELEKDILEKEKIYNILKK